MLGFEICTPYYNPSLFKLIANAQTTIQTNTLNKIDLNFYHCHNFHWLILQIVAISWLLCIEKWVTIRSKYPNN